MVYQASTCQLRVVELTNYLHQIDRVSPVIPMKCCRMLLIMWAQITTLLIVDRYFVPFVSCPVRDKSKHTFLILCGYNCFSACSCRVNTPTSL